ncbi:unnamed protein product [Gordionus sp. m RMFG-2023]|uniref:solute carrier family 2, facilitated glucose transporter member 1-like n=1 Tax=Gordionus sp. m RMFG-2023 TaxID=3053472 RepID=UPI0030E0C7C9
MNKGVTSGAVSIYLAEISPTNLRGSMCSAHQVMLSFAILISQLLGLPQVMGTSQLWPILFALTIIPAIIQISLLPFLPESPRYLLIYKEKEQNAKKALIILRNSPDVEDEIEQMKVEYQDQKRLPPVTWADMVKKQVYRKPLIIASETSISQQLTAISAVLSYSTALFISAGVAVGYATYITLALGLLYFLLCTLSLLIIEKAGRRTLFLTGLGGMWFCTLLITISLGIGNRHGLEWVSLLGVVFIFGYVGFCAIGPSVIAWFIPAELFTQSSRPKGMSIAVGFNWLSSFLAVFLFPILLSALQDYIFLVFTVLLALFWLFTYNYLPETQGRTSDELARLFMTPSEINRIHKFWRNYHFRKPRTHPHRHNHDHDTRL